MVSNQILNNVNLIQTNTLRTSFVHSSSNWNRAEKEGRKLRYGVKKEEEKYSESTFTRKNKKLNEKLTEPGTTTSSLFEKMMIITLIPFNHFPTVRGFLTSL